MSVYVCPWLHWTLKNVSRCLFYTIETGISTIWAPLCDWFHQQLSKRYFCWKRRRFHDIDDISVSAYFYYENIRLIVQCLAVTSQEIDQQLFKSNNEAVSVSKSSITSGFPQKGPVMWRSRVWARGQTPACSFSWNPYTYGNLSKSHSNHPGHATYPPRCI